MGKRIGPLPFSFASEGINTTGTHSVGVLPLTTLLLPLERKLAMAEPKKNDKPIVSAIETDGDIKPDDSLLPMLIGGLVLIVVGAIVIMMFV